jgi:hypothetical protein
MVRSVLHFKIDRADRGVSCKNVFFTPKTKTMQLGILYVCVHIMQNHRSYNLFRRV